MYYSQFILNCKDIYTLFTLINHTSECTFTIFIMKSKDNISTQRQKENPTRFFDPDEWEKFIYNCNLKWRPYFWIMMLTGLRHNEASNISDKDIDTKNKWIVILKAKGGRTRIRYVHLSSYALKFIKNFVKENNMSNNNTRFNFPTRQGMRQYMHEICKQQNIKGWNDFSTHNLRKTHENYLLTLNKDSMKVATHMGHTSKTALDHYVSSAFIKDKKQLDKIREWLGDIFE